MTNTNLVDLAIGRLLSLGSRDSQSGDVDEYNRYKAIVLLPSQLQAVLRNCSHSEMVAAQSAVSAISRGDERGLRVSMSLLAGLLPGFHSWR